MRISPDLDVRPVGPADRLRAADGLVYLAGTAIETAELAAARFDAAGTMVTRGDLLADFLRRISPAVVGASIHAAVDGALAVAPELEWRRADLHGAADAVAGVLLAAGSDLARARAWTTFDALYADLHAAAAPLYDAAADLAPARS